MDQDPIEEGAVLGRQDLDEMLCARLLRMLIGQGRKKRSEFLGARICAYVRYLLLVCLFSLTNLMSDNNFFGCNDKLILI